MSEQPPQDPRQPQPGWYPDPNGQQVLRWWDSTRWAAQTQPMPGTSGPQPSGPWQQPETVPLPGRTPKSWPARHKAPTAILGGAGLFILLIIIAAATGGGSKNESAAQSAASAGVVSTPSPAASPASSSSVPACTTVFIA